MRLTQLEHQVIVDEAHKAFGANCEVMLFGSRVDDAKRGGDIDLLIEGTYEPEQAFRRKLMFLSAVKHRIGDQKIDTIVEQPQDARLVVKVAKAEGVLL